MTPPLPPDSWADLPFFAQDWPAIWGRLAVCDDWQPPAAQIFRALELCPRPAVRVVILGQDPYPTPGRATGLAFGFPEGVAPRDSLKNMLTELRSDLGVNRPSGDLQGWARQGVLLLNTALTVPVGRANGHKGWGWDRLARQVLDATAQDGPRAYALWGGPAQKLGAPLPRDRGHLILTAPHPSPLSVYRGFYGSRPFSQINAWLLAQGHSPIDWAA